MKEVILIPSFEPDNRLIELIESINKERFDIIVIDDGSGERYKDIFKKIENDVTLISYDKNMGKGYALKKGIQYIKENYRDNYLIVTVDSDGQHKIDDAMKLCDYVKKNLDTYVLGKRKRGKNTPFRSMIGNSITKFVYYMVSGVNIYDTQTGLRCFSSNLTDFMLSIPGNRFEYEMNVLLSAPKSGFLLHEIEIKTIYIDKNKKSHFKTLKDAYIIYKSIMKYYPFICIIMIAIIMFMLFGLFFLIKLL